jgi:hypothetical protein
MYVFLAIVVVIAIILIYFTDILPRMAVYEIAAVASVCSFVIVLLSSNGTTSAEKITQRQQTDINQKLDDILIQNETILHNEEILLADLASKSGGNDYPELSGSSIILDKSGADEGEIIGAADMNQLLRSGLRQAKNLLQITLSSGATVASLGAGGDTIVDALFLVFSSGQMMADMGTFLYSNSDEIVKLSQVGFVGGPVGAAQRAMAVHTSYPVEQQVSAKAIIINNFQSLLELGGAILSTFIPDDGGFIAVGASWLGSIGGAIGTAMWHNALVGIYSLIPATLRAYIEDPVKLSNFLSSILDGVAAIINSDQDIWTNAKQMWKQTGWKTKLAAVIFPPILSSHVALTVAGQTEYGRKAVISVIDNVRPHIADTVKLVHMVMGLLFSSSVILSN